MRTWHVLWSVYKFLCSFTKKWNVFCKSLVTILFCYQETTSLLKRLTTLDDLQIGPNFSETNDLEEPVSITGLETFTLGYKVCSFLGPISSFCLLLYICTFAALLIMNLLEFLCLLIVFFRISLDPRTNLILWVSGSMAFITCHIKKSLNKVPVDISLSLSLQTRQPAAVRGMASTSSMQFAISSMTSLK